MSVEYSGSAAKASRMKRRGTPVRGAAVPRPLQPRVPPARPQPPRAIPRAADEVQRREEREPYRIGPAEGEGEGDGPEGRHDSERIQQRVREYQRKGEHDEVDEVEEERRAAEDEKRMLDREPEPVEAGQEEKGGTDGHKDVQKGGRVFLHFDEIEDGREA